MTETMFC